MSIHYLVGDATNPQIEGDKIIVHCCNNLGLWGAGFVLALSKKWKEPEAKYKQWANFFDEEKEERMPLGYIQSVRVEKNIWVVNLIGQNGVRSKENPKPLCLWSIMSGFEKVKNKFNVLENYSIHMPRIGCGLAGGKWEEIEPIIKKYLSGLDVYVYDLKE